MGIVTSSGRKATLADMCVPPFSSLGVARHQGQIVTVSKSELVRMIREAWAAVGHDVMVRVAPDGEIRSNLVNGLPPKVTD